MILRAPAKINLGLQILSKREDGYHELNSIFYRLEEPSDLLDVHTASRFEFASSEQLLPIDVSNLVVRAMHLFAEATNSAVPPLDIKLEKQIPVGAGLGGGSSDAATALRICNFFSEIKLSEIELRRLALRLGADVPFFLEGSPCAVARGIGEILTPLALNVPYRILIAKLPDVAVRTKEAYAEVKFTSNSTPIDFAKVCDGGFNLQLANEYLQNDFERSVFYRYPVLAELKQKIVRLGAGYASMSGSGSALFGLFEEQEIAEKALVELDNAGVLTFLNIPTS